jgi:hypothetical protein
MIVLNELTEDGVRRLEVWPDDVGVVTNRPMRSGSEVSMIDGRVYCVAEEVSEVFAMIGESDGDQRDELA